MRLIVYLIVTAQLILGVALIYGAVTIDNCVLSDKGKSADSCKELRDAMSTYHLKKSAKDISTAAKIIGGVVIISAMAGAAAARQSHKLIAAVQCVFQFALGAVSFIAGGKILDVDDQTIIQVVGYSCILNGLLTVFAGVLSLLVCGCGGFSKDRYEDKTFQDASTRGKEALNKLKKDEEFAENAADLLTK